MDEKINVIENSNNVIYDFISSFKVLNNDILLMTKNEYDENGNIKLICTKIYNNILLRIDDDLWTNVKIAMRDIVSGNSGNYSFIKLNSNNYESSEDYIRSIGLKVSEKDKIVHDYKEYNVEDEIQIPVLQNINIDKMIENNEEDVEELDIVPENKVEDLHSSEVIENEENINSVVNIDTVPLNNNVAENKEQVEAMSSDNVINIDTVPLYDNVNQQEVEEVEKLEL